jgi:succinoglycan biosynthesis protein ExoM
VTAKVAVCICTFERPTGLRALLHALDVQRLCTLSTNDIQLIIVDNSASASAAPIFFEYLRAGKFPATFLHEKSKGLSNARNAAIESASALGIAFIAFVDDDEIPLPDWIENLLAKAEKTGAAAVVGPVLPIFEEPPQAWAAASGFFAKVLPSRNGYLEDGHTANCLVSWAVVRGERLRFDPRFNETGGEDTLFFKSLRGAGERIAWAEDAIVMELVPKQRMTRGWLLRRWYRTGAIEAALCGVEPSSRKGKLINLLKGMSRVGGGVLLIAGAAMLWPFRHPGSILAQCYTLCRGAGLLMSIIGKEYKEYSASGYR